MKEVVTAILAGGKGTRMDILCQLRPKPALPFAGKLRIIDFSLSNSINSQINDITIFVDYQHANLENYVRQWQHENMTENKLDIMRPRNGSYFGTADAMYQNLDYLQKHTADRVLILSGDHVYKMDFRRMLAFHEQIKADITVGVVPVPLSEACRFGTVTLGIDDRVINFVEKSETPPSNLASMGIYIFNKDILMKRLIEDAAEPNSPHDFGYAILPRMVERDRVYAYRYDDFWRDIGTVASYYATSMEFTNGKSPFSLNDTWPILTVNDNREPAKKFPRGSVENSIVSPGCVIKGRVENSILSPGVWVDEQSAVRNSILMSNVFVGYHSVVESCVADEEVNIGKYCFIGFGNDGSQKEYCSVLGKGAAVPSHTAIACGCRIAPFLHVTDSIGRVLIDSYHSGEIKRIPALA
jgi:glucose-1-phosphate adenylyltransferase